jgi:hypothetical protein
MPMFVLAQERSRRMFLRSEFEMRTQTMLVAPPV